MVRYFILVIIYPISPKLKGIQNTNWNEAGGNWGNGNWELGTTWELLTDSNRKLCNNNNTTKSAEVSQQNRKQLPTFTRHLISISRRWDRQIKRQMERQMFCGQYFGFGNCRLRPGKMHKMPNWHLDVPEYGERFTLIIEFPPEFLDLRSHFGLWNFTNLQLNIFIIIRVRMAITLWDCIRFTFLIDEYIVLPGSSKGERSSLMKSGWHPLLVFSLFFW